MSQWIWVNVEVLWVRVRDGRRFGGRHSLHGSLLSCHFLGIFLFFCRSLDKFCKINDNDNDKQKYHEHPDAERTEKINIITQIWNQFWWGCCCCCSFSSSKNSENSTEHHKTMAFLILHRDTEPIWSENYLVSVSSCGVASHKWIHLLTVYHWFR